jgi:iron(III) transport system ATP-binding protein
MLTIADLSVAYPPAPGSTTVTPVVRALSLSLARGEIGCLLGGSGCGKTTVLRAIAGFEPVQQGSIRIEDELVSSADTLLAPERRRIGMVFQDYALFPHLNVARNVGFGLHGLDRPAWRARVDEMLALVGLEDMAERYPHALSGGQQQRVALARALAPQPRLLLLDEPFSNLDVNLREHLAGEVREILKAAGATAILVTHDQREAFAVADRIGVMADGRLHQWDTPFGLYHRPADRTVAAFVGEGVLLPAAAHGMADDLAAPASAQPDATVFLRPEDVGLDDASPRKALIESRVFRGSDYLYTLVLDSGERVLALGPSREGREPGAQVGVLWRGVGVVLSA